MGRAKKELVWVPLSWCDTYVVETIKFLCPNCSGLTNRKQVKNAFSSITCKYCKRKYKLDYGFDIQHPDEIRDNYGDGKWIMHFPDDIDEQTKQSLIGFTELELKK